VRPGQAGYGLAGQARFVGVWCGAARIGSLRQAGIGGFRFVRAGSGLFRQARFVAACSGSFGQGQAGKFRLGGARCGSVRFGTAGTVWLGGVCSGIVWYGWQVRRDKVGHGEVRQVGLGGARWS